MSKGQRGRKTTNPIKCLPRGENSAESLTKTAVSGSNHTPMRNCSWHSVVPLEQYAPPDLHQSGISVKTGQRSPSMDLRRSRLFRSSTPLQMMSSKQQFQANYLISTANHTKYDNRLHKIMVSSTPATHQNRRSMCTQNDRALMCLHCPDAPTLP